MHQNGTNNLRMRKTRKRALIFFAMSYQKYLYPNIEKKTVCKVQRNIIRTSSCRMISNKIIVKGKVIEISCLFKLHTILNLIPNIKCVAPDFHLVSF